jgi:adiponectin receptor
MPPKPGTPSGPNPGPDPNPDQPPSSGLRHRRPSTTTSPSTLLSTTAQTLSTAETAVETTLLRLLHWDDLPPWRRDNPSILYGYRPTSNSFRASFHSLLYLHNESVNIWSHLFGAVAFTLGGLYLHALIAPRYESASSADVLVFGCFFGGAFCCLGMSATYHLLCNHSEEVARWGNKLDYTGIVFLIVGSYVPALWYGF